MPVTIQAGRTTATVPPTAALRGGAFPFGNVAEDARVAAVVVTVNSAEAGAILVNARIGATDGVAFKQRCRLPKYVINTLKCSAIEE